MVSPMSFEQKRETSKVLIGLAPMEGVTDFPTRLWFQLIGGMDFTWTPFLRVTDTFPQKFPELFAPELTLLKGLMPKPLVLQVMGSRPQDIVRAAQVIGERTPFIDLNCGCPSPTVVGSRAGSSLLQYPEDFGAFIEHVVQELGPGRLSVKMRTGYQDDGEFTGLLRCLEGLPLRHLTVHGRTRPARYQGLADWSLIDHAAHRCPFPVYGSGDINDRTSLQHNLMRASKISGVIIGRGALRNPWVFRGDREAPVVVAFLAFVIFQDVFLESPLKLIEWASNLSVDDFEQQDESTWSRLLVGLLKKTRGQTLGEAVIGRVTVSSRALSRGKMLWNYLRSSLPPAFMEPALMRCSTLGAWFDAVTEIARQQQLSSARLPIVYNPDHDWMYSGAGRGQ
jgi:tRNA-dihydrouridine synthase